MLEYIFRINHDLFPKYLNDLIEQKITSVHLRSENNICIPKFSTVTYGKHSFRYASASYIYGDSYLTTSKGVKALNILNVLFVNLYRNVIVDSVQYVTY